MTRLWERIPVIVRAIAIGIVVNEIGQLGSLLIFANLKFLPRFPWMLPATAAWLWLFWRYASGRGWPSSTREARRTEMRAPHVPGAVWKWALLAGGLGLTSVVTIGFLTPRLTEIPLEAFKIPLDFSAYPWWTDVSILASISATAGVVEEAAFRGYMLSPIQRRHGWVTATAVTGIVFFMAHHLSHAYATFAFLPFFLAVSALHALLVYFTGSIRPSVVLHAAFDFLVIPLQYGVIGRVPSSSILNTGVDSSFLLEIGVFLVFGAAAIPAFLSLEKRTRDLRTESVSS